MPAKPVPEGDPFRLLNISLLVRGIFTFRP